MLKLKPVLLLLFIPPVLSSCYRTCDCFDEPNYAFGFSVDIKSHDSTLSVLNFLTQRDSSGHPLNYRIQTIFFDSSLQSGHFDWSGDGHGDSLIYFTVWNPTNSRFPIERLEFDIPSLNIHHNLGQFKLEGRLSRGSCSCFTATKKSVTLDDSLEVNTMENDLKF